MKKIEKKLDAILQKTNKRVENVPETEALEKILQLLEALEKTVDQRIDDKDFLKAFRKTKHVQLLENLKSVYEPAFSVTNLDDIKKKILAWLMSGESDKDGLSLGDIFQDYLNNTRKDQAF